MRRLILLAALAALGACAKSSDDRLQEIYKEELVRDPEQAKEIARIIKYKQFIPEANKRQVIDAYDRMKGLHDKIERERQ